jgi:signal transduction histidine kinase
MNLRAKSILFFSMICLLTTSVVELWWFPKMEQLVTRNLLESERDGLRAVSDMLTSTLLNNNYSTVHESLDALHESRPDWRQITLYDGAGEEIYPLGGDDLESNPDFITIEYKISFRNLDLGRIVLVVDPHNRLTELREQINWLSIVIGLFAVLVLLAILFFVEYFVGTPARRLSEATLKIASGNFDAPVGSGFNDEIGELAKNFIAMRQKLIESNLEKERAQLGLESSLEIAEKANQAKSEFLSSMSHELRTPMNSILGFGQMLELTSDPPLSADQRDSVQHIMKGGQHLLELIDDVLDFAKIEAGHVGISLEDTAVEKVLEECLTIIGPGAGRRGVDIAIDRAEAEITGVHVDRTRFKQILLNLLSNAVKYNRENGSVTVFIQEAPGHRLRIAITDTGSGIAEEKQGELFKPFSRLGAETTEIEGTGIGLVVCKNLIALMNGDIGMESEVGKGSTFWIELPRAKGEQENGGVPTGIPLARPGGSSPGMRGKLLYVEDNPDNLKLMEKIISHVEGLSMISAYSGEAGLELARTELPDIIILDINLPGMDGDKVLEELRSTDSTKDIPVMALSAAATARDIERGMQAGFLAYMTKPVQVPFLLDSIKAALK